MKNSHINNSYMKRAGGRYGNPAQLSRLSQASQRLRMSPTEASPRISNAGTQTEYPLRGGKIWATAFLVIFTLACLAAITAIRLPGIALLPVLSESMNPYFGTDDLLLSCTVTTESIRQGDIIIYSDPSDAENLRIAHRVIAVTAEGFITKGDSNQYADTNPVRAESVQGKVAFVLPFAGRIINTAGGNTSLMIIVGAAVYITLLCFVLSPKKAIPREKTDMSLRT